MRRWAEGISEKMLAQTLRTLEADGLVERQARPVVPPHVDYRLTERGRELTALILPLMEWVNEHVPEHRRAAGPGGAGPRTAVTRVGGLGAVIQPL